jgi:hypothetical protein
MQCKAGFSRDIANLIVIVVASLLLVSAYLIYIKCIKKKPSNLLGSPKG